MSSAGPTSAPAVSGNTALHIRSAKAAAEPARSADKKGPLDEIQQDNRVVHDPTLGVRRSGHLDLLSRLPVSVGIGTPRLHLAAIGKAPDMGTRADFYVGKGKDAEWLGSIAWDGYRGGISGYILKATREEDYRKAVDAFLKSRDDATFPEQGWPWPWDNSHTTDCSYWFFDGRCWDAQSYPTKLYVPCDEPEPDWSEDDEGELERKWLDGREPIDFPDMSERKNVAGGSRSGLITITAT